MAKQLEQVFIVKAKTEEAVKSVKDLRNNVKVYKNELVTLNRGSDEYNAKLQEIAESQTALNKINRDARNATANLTDVYAGLTRTVAGVTSGFQVATSAATLFGLEGDNLVGTIARLQSIQGLVTGLYGLSNGIKNAANILPRLNTAFKAFNATLLKSPIFWLAAVVTAVGVALKGLDKWLSNSRSGVDELNRSYQLQIQAAEKLNAERDYEILKLKAQGTSILDIINIRRQQIREDIAATRIEVENRDREIQALEAKNKAWFSGERKRLEALREIQGEEISRLDALIDTLEALGKEYTIATISEQTARNNRLAQKAKSDAAARLKLEIETNEALEDIEKRFWERYTNIRRLGINRINQLADDARDYFYDVWEEVLSDDMLLEEIPIPLFDAFTEWTSNEAIEERQSAYQQEIENLQQLYREQVRNGESTIETYKRLKQAQKEYAEFDKAANQQIQKNNQNTQKVREATLAAYSTLLSNSANIFAENTAGAKVLSGASALISTYAGIAQTLGDPELPFSIKIPASISIGTAGFAAFKKLFDTDIPGASSDTSSAVSMPSLPSMPEVDTSPYEVYTTLNPSDVDNLNQSQTVLVVEDFDNVQNRVNAAEISASF